MGLEFSFRRQVLRLRIRQLRTEDLRQRLTATHWSPSSTNTRVTRPATSGVTTTCCRHRFYRTWNPHTDDPAPVVTVASSMPARFTASSDNDTTTSGTEPFGAADDAIAPVPDCGCVDDEEAPPADLPRPARGCQRH